MALRGIHEGRKTKEVATQFVQVRNVNGLGWVGDSRDWKKWMGLGYVLEVETTGISGRLGMVGEQV